MTDHPRLIEVAFLLKQASLDSVHEKNVRHGHMSTLHIWPARRPLAACRAALIATLLPDPGTPQSRKELLEKIGGKAVTEVQKKKVGGKTVETIEERTEGGVLRWGNENSPDMDWFRAEIKKAYGGRAPRVLDPFRAGRGDSARGHAARVRDDDHRHQPRRLVHPQMHPGVSPKARRSDPAAAHVRARVGRVDGGVPQGDR
jgi:hypothetical protein